MMNNTEKTLNLLFHTRMFGCNISLYGTASAPYIAIEDCVSMALKTLEHIKPTPHTAVTLQQHLLSFLEAGEYIEFSYERGMEQTPVIEVYVKARAFVEYIQTAFDTPESNALASLLDNLTFQVFEIAYEDSVHTTLEELSEELLSLSDKPLNPYRAIVEHKENEFPLAYGCESDNLDIYIFEDGENPVVLAEDVAKWMNVSRYKVLNAVRPSEMVVNTFKEGYELFLYVDGIYRAVQALATPQKAEAILKEFDFHLHEFWMLEQCCEECEGCVCC